jgi:hypothetical protein
LETKPTAKALKALPTPRTRGAIRTRRAILQYSNTPTLRSPGFEDEDEDDDENEAPHEPVGFTAKRLYTIAQGFSPG